MGAPSPKKGRLRRNRKVIYIQYTIYRLYVRKRLSRFPDRKFLFPLSGRKGTSLRRDPYYRLSGHKVHLAPLWERKEDIPLLVDAFLSEAAEAEGKRKPTVPPELYTLQSAYDFPGNVREALGKILFARDAGDPFRLVVTDIRMPVMSGIELIDALREEGIESALCAITCFGDQALVSELAGKGCTEYIEKPFSPDDLVQRIRAILEGDPPG